MIVRLIPVYPANLATYEESWIFGRPKRAFWTPVAPKRDVIRYEILHPSFFSAHCASLMPRGPLLRGEGGLHILSCAKNVYFFLDGRVFHTLRYDPSELTQFHIYFGKDNDRYPLNFLFSKQKKIIFN